MDTASFDEKADVYSFAILLWEIVSGTEWDGGVVNDSSISIYDIEDQFKNKVLNENFRPPLEGKKKKNPDHIATDFINHKSTKKIRGIFL